MGDIADMMLDGTICQGCGDHIGDGDGFPVYCGSCDNEMDFFQPQKQSEKVSCPHCKKKVKAAGLTMHIKAVHPLKAAEQLS